MEVLLEIPTWREEIDATKARMLSQEDKQEEKDVLHTRLLHRAENHVRNNSDEEISFMKNQSRQQSTRGLHPPTGHPISGKELQWKTREIKRKRPRSMIIIIHWLISHNQKKLKYDFQSNHNKTGITVTVQPKKGKIGNYPRNGKHKTCY